MREILNEHAKRYPKMEARDWFKLLYQSEFGGGHLIADKNMALRRLENEINALYDRLAQALKAENERLREENEKLKSQLITK